MQDVQENDLVGGPADIVHHLKRGKGGGERNHQVPDTLWVEMRLDAKRAEVCWWASETSDCLGRGGEGLAQPDVLGFTTWRMVHRRYDHRTMERILLKLSRAGRMPRTMWTRVKVRCLL